MTEPPASEATTQSHLVAVDYAYIPEKEFFGPLAHPYSEEDRYLKLALKIGLVAFVLALEVIIVGVVAIFMWNTVH